MWYAILDLRSDVTGVSWLAYGTLRDIADAVLEQCVNCDPEGREVLDFDAISREGFYYEADAYTALCDTDVVTPDLLKGFSFCISDASVTVHCLAEGYAAFRLAFDGYRGRNGSLSDLRLPETLAAEEELAFAREFADILFEDEYYDDLSPGRVYVAKKE